MNSLGCGVCAVAEDCINGVDDDGDGDVDCADADCIADPLCGASNDCCMVNGSAGCSDTAIESCVCAQDAYCCNTDWDQLCVDEVTQLGCGSCP